MQSLHGIDDSHIGILHFAFACMEHGCGVGVGVGVDVA